MTRRHALLLMLAVLAGCSSKPSGPAPLRVAAASDLQDVFPILAARFKMDTGIEVEGVFGASGQLAQQIKAGGPFDLYMSANRTLVEDLAKAGAIKADSVRPYARGTLVLIVNNLFDPGVKMLADVGADKVKSVAIANPDLAPYGAAAKGVLERAGLWEKVKPKLVYGENVRQVVEFVRTGNAEVGFAGKSVADVKGVRSIPLDPDAYAPIVQAMGVVAASKRPADAERFAAFLLGADGQGILRQFGFQSLGPKD
jgi:molybdate transport system substrate-binding protein